ncbi:MAG: SPW repeat protein [Candidatus Binatia bacterium]
MIHLKRRMLLNLILGLWLMISPFVLVTLNHTILKTLWEDLLLGFGIAAFSLCRLLSRKEDEIALSDWFVTALGFITLINPFLYSYFKLKAAAWNNLSVGALVLLLALYQDWCDTDARDNAQHESRT